MLAPLLGSVNSERVLLYLYARGEGYGREIARFFSTNLTPVQRQLEKFEANGILVSRSVGRTRLYSLNPRYAYRPEIEKLLEKSLRFIPDDKRAELLMNRRRPRRSGKPL